MKLCWIPFLVLVSCIQCASKIEVLEPEVVYITDTVYIEKEVVPELKPWILECIDTAWTNYDLDVCSRECLEVADSILDERYQIILEDYNLQIADTKDSDYAEIYPGHNQVLRQQKADFQKLYLQYDELKLTLSNLVKGAMGDARLTTFCVNSYLLGIVEDQIELYNNLEPWMFEIE